MKTAVLFSVTGEAADFEPLIAAANERGVRVGWLAWESGPAKASALRNPPLVCAFRSVEVSDDWTISAKPRRGPAILRDLLREHFLGADVVLVKGLELFPRLARHGKDWELEEAVGRKRTLSTEALLDRARKPELRWKERKEETK